MNARMLLLTLLAGSVTCFAQSNVGELQQQGGKKLSAEETKQLHAGGVTLKGQSPGGNPLAQTLKADGSVSGNLQARIGTAGVGGIWKIDDAGKLCISVTIYGGPGGKIDTCAFIWQMADKYFSAEADDPATKVQAHVLQR